MRPEGAEIAKPAKGFDAADPAAEPDPTGRVMRIEPESVTAEVTVVPRRAAGTNSPCACGLPDRFGAKKVHWNNEADPLQVWLDPPDNWVVSTRLLTAPLPEAGGVAEDRRIEFEVKVPATATATETIRGYALFHVCDDEGGVCRFARLDIHVDVPVARSTRPR